MTITEFLEARLSEDEAVARRNSGNDGITDDGSYPDYQTYFDDDTAAADAYLEHYRPARVLAECAAKRAIIEQHKDWPVLVEKKPEFSADATDLQSITMRVSQEMAWLTEREYVKRFGVEPPATPVIRALAAVYKDHPDYRQDWAL